MSDKIKQKEIDDCNSIYEAILNKVVEERISSTNGIKAILTIFTSLFTSTYEAEVDDLIVNDIKNALKEARKLSESSDKKGVH